VPIVVVSPHFDDAVLSCWSLVESDAEIDVVTVYSAGPDDPALISRWDSDTGVTSQVRMQQRAEENRAALALAGRSATNLGGLEGQYGDGSVDEEVLAAAIRDAEVVYLPAATATHDDHVNKEHARVRDAGLRIRPDARLYADQPYNHFRSGLELPPDLRARFGDRQEVQLSSSQRARKARALACYAGELQKLANGFGLELTDSDVLTFETFWQPRVPFNPAAR
jgi:LmbE family N-acetylglucosaminyl deacetylase